MSSAPNEIENEKALQGHRHAWGAILRLVRDGASWSGRERNCAWMNLGGAGFAGVSGLLGLDGVEDGRALAVTDWDGDGDLDLWYRNRSAPRLRLLLNRSELDGDAGKWVALRLIGKSANRDGIGARVTVDLGGDAGRLHRTVRAGSGFLSQSSKWLHFGLGASATIESVTVRWPGGEEETVSGVEVGARYLVRQGSRRAKVFKSDAARAEGKLANGKPLGGAVPPVGGGGFQAILPAKVPLPNLKYVVDGREQEVSALEGAAFVLLHSPKCPECAVEMKRLDERLESLRSAGLRVLTLSVESGAGGVEGVIDAESLERLDPWRRGLFDNPRPFAVPYGILVDAEGSAFGVTEGAISWERLLADALAHDADNERLRDLALPYPGKWFTKAIEAPQMAVFIADAFKASDAVEFLRLRERGIESDPNSERRLTMGQELGSLAYFSGQELARSGKPEAAEAQFRRALRWLPNEAPIHNDLGALLANQGRLADAEKSFLRSLELVPDNAMTKENLERIRRLRSQ